mgnify:CR=1 FL=1
MTHFLHYLNRFTKTWCAALAGMMLMAVPAAHASFSVDVHPSGSIPDLPDPAGRAGMIAGTVAERGYLPERKAKPVSGGRTSPSYERLVAVGQMVMESIKRSKGRDNKSLAKFADQLRQLLEKWEA